MAKYQYIKANSHSYGKKRDRNDVRFIVVHYTGNRNDSPLQNCLYFKNVNTRSAGAHFFVGRDGTVIKSVAMNLVAWSVGGKYAKREGGGSYYGKCTNSNSVSIELCDIANKQPSVEQIKAVKKLVKHIRKYCPNAKTIIRHFDVNNKICPATLIDSTKWNQFLLQIK